MADQEQTPPTPLELRIAIKLSKNEGIPLKEALNKARELVAEHEAADGKPKAKAKVGAKKSR